MFIVTTEKNNLRVEGAELMTSGSVNVNYIQLNTSDDWRNLNRVILFRTNKITIAINIGVDLGAPLIMAIPWEVLETAGETIQVGLYGTSQANFDEIVLPTIWGTIGKVVQGVFLSGSSNPAPTEDLFRELLKKIDDMEDKMESEILQFDYLTPSQVDQIVSSNKSYLINQNGRKV